MNQLKLIFVGALALLTVACGGDDRIDNIIETQNEIVTIQEQWLDKQLARGGKLSTAKISEWTKLSTKLLKKSNKLKKQLEAIKSEGVEPTDSQKEEFIAVMQRSQSVAKKYLQLI